MTAPTDCDCSEEYGPCETHCQQYAQRVGSSNRSADELMSVFLDDGAALLPETDRAPYLELATRVDAALESQGPFSSWLDDTDLAEEMRDAADRLESDLGSLGFWTFWEDGYVIVKPTGDCPLL